VRDPLRRSAHRSASRAGNPPFGGVAIALPLRDETWEGAREAATCPPPTAEHTAAYGQPELACDTPRLPPERRRATGSPSGLDRPLDHPSRRDPTVPRTAGRTKNGRSPDGSGGGRDSSASCSRCTSSFTCFAWRPTGAIGTPRPLPFCQFRDEDRGTRRKLGEPFGEVGGGYLYGQGFQVRLRDESEIALAPRGYAHLRDRSDVARSCLTNDEFVVTTGVARWVDSACG
jgi:hypothetical protein